MCGQVEGMKKKEERQEKLVSETLAENKRLSEPLAEAKAELSDIRKQVWKLNRPFWSVTLFGSCQATPKTSST